MRKWIVRFKRRTVLNRQVKQMKKLIMLLCAASICMMAIGCSGGESTDGGQTPNTTTDKPAQDAGTTQTPETK